MKYEIEYTDTFGGEANYCWCHRYLIELPDNASKRQICRSAKKAAGLSGLRGSWDTYGEVYTFRPYGSCTILFASYYDEGARQ